MSLEIELCGLVKVGTMKWCFSIDVDRLKDCTLQKHISVVQFSIFRIFSAFACRLLNNPVDREADTAPFFPHTDNLLQEATAA